MSIRFLLVSAIRIIFRPAVQVWSSLMIFGCIGQLHNQNYRLIVCGDRRYSKRFVSIRGLYRFGIGPFALGQIRNSGHRLAERPLKTFTNFMFSIKSDVITGLMAWTLLLNWQITSLLVVARLLSKSFCLLIKKFALVKTNVDLYNILGDCVTCWPFAHMAR